MTSIRVILLFIAVSITGSVFAQIDIDKAINRKKAERALKKAEEEFEAAQKEREQRFNAFKEQRRKDFEEFRRQRNAEFAEFVRSRWERFDSHPEITRPKEDEVPPVIFDKDKMTPPAPITLPFDGVIKMPLPTPQPIPIDPIEELPLPIDEKPIEDKPIDESPINVAPIKEPVVPEVPTCTFELFGNTMKVRMDKQKVFRLKRVNENVVANAWLKLSGSTYTNLIYDCLRLREKHSLCDWAYLRMLDNMSAAVCGAGTNEATLLMAYVYCQSGYKMRLAEDNGHLRMLYASKHLIYRKSYFKIDGENFYPYGKTGSQLYICEAAYPKEQSMSLQINQSPDFSWKSGGARTLKSARYPEMAVQTVCNENMIDFYSSYPSSEVDGNFMTCWAMYANTPLEQGVRNVLYPALLAHIENLSKKEAVERLLNWVQTAFEYEYDSKVWGGERAFFPEESLYYPYCDCEDRSILFTRLVRDLVGLECILIHYPGHLASAVCFDNETVNGDFITLNGKKFVVCDPTYINASVGLSMPDLSKNGVKIILLN